MNPLKTEGLLSLPESWWKIVILAPKPIFQGYPKNSMIVGRGKYSSRNAWNFFTLSYLSRYHHEITPQIVV